MTYIREPLRGIPIRYKKIKGKLYAYQRVDAHRDKATGQVVVKDRYLGAVIPARPKPLLEKLDQTDIDIITKAWQRGDGIEWVQTYVKTVLQDKPSQATVYNWLRAHGIKRDKRTSRRAEKRITEAEARVERVKQLKREEQARKTKQAKRREQAQNEIKRLKS